MLHDCIQYVLLARHMSIGQAQKKLENLRAKSQTLWKIVSDFIQPGSPFEPWGFGFVQFDYWQFNAIYNPLSIDLIGTSID